MRVPLVLLVACASILPLADYAEADWVVPPLIVRDAQGRCWGVSNGHVYVSEACTPNPRFIAAYP